MTLDEAIRHAEEVAEEQKELYKLCPADMFCCDGTKDCKTLKNGKNKGCQKCAEEHRQIAEWLRELKRFRDAATDTDTISRQAAIRWVKTECNPYGKPTLDFESGKKVIEHLEQMPSADRPIGHWVLVNRGLDIYMCDQCGEILQIDRVPIWDYCPVCGARMGGNCDD